MAGTLMTTLTAEQRKALESAGDQPVEMVDPVTNTAYVLVKAEAYRRMRALIEDEASLCERQAWSHLGAKARAEWAVENTWE